MHNSSWQRRRARCPAFPECQAHPLQLLCAQLSADSAPSCLLPALLLQMASSTLRSYPACMLAPLTVLRAGYAAAKGCCLLALLGQSRFNL